MSLSLCISVPVMYENSSFQCPVEPGSRVKMRCLFQSQHDDKLSYKKDELMTVIIPEWKKENDFTWVLCENSEGKMGLLFVDDMECDKSVHPCLQESRSGALCHANENFMKARPWELDLEKGKTYTLLWKATPNWWEVSASGAKGFSPGTHLDVAKGFSPGTHLDVYEKCHVYDTVDEEDRVPLSNEEQINENEEIQIYEPVYEDPDKKVMTNTEDIYASPTDWRKSLAGHHEGYSMGNMMNLQNKRKNEDDIDASPTDQRKSFTEHHEEYETRLMLNLQNKRKSEDDIYQSLSSLRKSSTEHREYETYDELNPQD
uniref:uncharacterized protein isoform X2 n=1 Tax=Myxine glutinosa TaxID=7769 RepID=UPI00358E1DE0